MNLIDIYIAEVGKHLPAKHKNDLLDEIHSALQDMLEDRSQQSGRQIDDDLMIEVLQEYGSPEKVAASYLPERYLIGPRLFPAFLKIVQIVIPIVAVLAVIGLGLSLSRTSLNPYAWIETVIQAFAEFFSAAATSLGFIVLIFAILEWVMPTLKEKTWAWDPRSLRKISPPDRVAMSGPITAIIFTLAAAVIFNFYPQVIGIGYISSGDITSGKWIALPLLSEAFFRYLPMLNLLWVLQIILSIILLRRGQWQPWTRWTALVVNALGIGLAYAMLTGPALVGLNAGELSAVSPLQPNTADFLVRLMNQGVRLALIIAIVSGIIDMVKISIGLFGKKPPLVFIRE